MQEITSYKTRDHEIFEDKAEAKKHEAKLDFEDWYKTNTLYSWNGLGQGSDVEVEYFIEWLVLHKDTVLGLLDETNH